MAPRGVRYKDGRYEFEPRIWPWLLLAALAVIGQIALWWFTRS